MKIIKILSVAKEKDLSRFFELGLNWTDSRCLNFIYTPDEKLVAGIFTLGLLCRDLCIESKNDKNLHFNKLLNNAKDYLEKCKSCKYICQPDLAKCGRFEQAQSQYKKIGEAKNYTVTAIDLIDRTITVGFTKKPTKKTPYENETYRTIIEGYSDEWHIHGMPSLIQHERKPALGEIYKELTNEKAIKANLGESYSQISFVTSNLQELKKFNELEIEINGKQELMGKLLTLSNESVSRLNSITAISRRGIESAHQPKNIIFSDLYSFLKSIHIDRFRGAEKFIFFNSTESDTKLSELYEYISSNRDWLTINEKNTQMITFCTGLGSADVIILNET